MAIEMYGDYFEFLKTSKKNSGDGVFRQLYLSALKRNLEKELKEASVISHIALKTTPVNFTQKRLAMVTGYKEGARLAKVIRGLK